MNEYKYAVQWRYKGQEQWFTLVSHYKELESARRDSKWIRENHDNMETRIVRRPKVESWEVVE